jgi:hypothetical protein
MPVMMLEQPKEGSKRKPKWPSAWSEAEKWLHNAGDQRPMKPTNEAVVSRQSSTASHFSFLPDQTTPRTEERTDIYWFFDFFSSFTS